MNILGRIPPMADSKPNACLFCTLPQKRIVMANGLAMAVRDAFPVSPGHTVTGCVDPHKNGVVATAKSNTNDNEGR